MIVFCFQDELSNVEYPGVINCPHVCICHSVLVIFKSTDRPLLKSGGCKRIPRLWAAVVYTWWRPIARRRQCRRPPFSVRAQSSSNDLLSSAVRFTKGMGCDFHLFTNCFNRRGLRRTTRLSNYHKENLLGASSDWKMSDVCCDEPTSPVPRTQVGFTQTARHQKGNVALLGE